MRRAMKSSLARCAGLAVLALAASGWWSAGAAQKLRPRAAARQAERQQRAQAADAANDDPAGVQTPLVEAPVKGRAARNQIGGDELQLLPRGLAALQMRALIFAFRQLNLTEEQRGQLRQLHSKYGNQLPVLNRLHRAQNEALDEAIYAQNFDPKLVEQRAADAAATQAEMVKTRARIMAEMRQILTPEQVVKFRQLLEQERSKPFSEATPQGAPLSN